MQQLKLMRIRADLDPQPWVKLEVELQVEGRILVYVVGWGAMLAVVVEVRW